MPDTVHNEEHSCPVCGAANQCVIARGEDPASCWCMSIDVDPAILQGLPDHERGRRCLCRECASGTALAIDASNR